MVEILLIFFLKKPNILLFFKTQTAFVKQALYPRVLITCLYKLNIL